MIAYIMKNKRTIKSKKLKNYLLDAENWSSTSLVFKLEKSG